MTKASAYTGGIASEWPVTYVNGAQRLAPLLNTFAQFRRYTFEDKLVTSLGAVYTYFQMVRGEFHEYGVSFGFDSIYDDTATNVVAGVGQAPFLRIKMNEGDAKAESWWHSAAFTHGGSTEANGGAGTHWEGDVKFTGTYKQHMDLAHELHKSSQLERECQIFPYRSGRPRDHRGKLYVRRNDQARSAFQYVRQRDET